MSKHRQWRSSVLGVVLVLACAGFVPLALAGTPPTGAGDAAATGLLPAKTFARHAHVSSPRLSPDGKHLLVTLTGADSSHHALRIYRLSDMSVVSQLNLPIYQLPVGAIWVSNDWIALEIGKRMGSLDKPVNTGQVIATSIDGKHKRYLFGWNSKGWDARARRRGSDEGTGYIVGRPQVPNGHVYVGAQPFGRENLSILYDIDVAHNGRHLLAHMNVSGLSFMLDPDGKAAFAFGTNSKFEYVVYRKDGTRWHKLKPGQMGDYFSPIAYTLDRKHLYALISKDGGPYSLIKENLEGGQREVLASNSFASIDDLQWTAVPEQPFAAMTSAGVPKAMFFGSNTRDIKLYMALDKAFAGKTVDFINFSQDGGLLLFYVSSDRDPGTYYLINTKTFKVQKLFPTAPWINPKQMAARQPFRFKADDGTELEGILTIPPHRLLKNLPMVLLPHGGPHGVQDTWYFDWDAQFLASRGYLVLQINYRGSGGRGQAFVQSGYRKWGTRIQKDLINGVHWAIDQHYADPKRICVYGGSFGGYSALMSVIRAPKLFKCAVGYAGVYDLAMMFDKGDIQSSDSGRSYLETVLGHDPAELAANSPDKLADKIQVPVFLVHGKDDERAPYAGAEAMRDAMDAAHKPYEWMAVDREGHGFYTEEHRTEFLTRLQAFLTKYIGPGAPVAGK